LWRSWKAQQFLSWRMEKSTHSLGATGGNPIECLLLEGPYTQCVYKWVDTIHLDNRLDMMRLVTVFKRLLSVSLNEAVHHFGQNKTQYPPWRPGVGWEPLPTSPPYTNHLTPLLFLFGIC
jgi:hypothetical protein